MSGIDHTEDPLAEDRYRSAVAPYSRSDRDPEAMWLNVSLDRKPEYMSEAEWMFASMNFTHRHADQEEPLPERARAFLHEMFSDQQRSELQSAMAFPSDREGKRAMAVARYYGISYEAAFLIMWDAQISLDYALFRLKRARRYDWGLRGENANLARGRSTIYFAFNSDKGRIKVGVTVDYDKRLRQLEAKDRTKLQTLGTMAGDYWIEQEIHSRLIAWRVRSETYRESDAMTKQPIPLAMLAWLNETGSKRVALADRLRITRQHLHDILTDRRQISDDMIPFLPDGLWETVRDIRVQHYQAQINLVMHRAIQKTVSE